MNSVRFLLSALLALAIPAALAAAEWADLSGQFVYDGKPPKPTPITVTKDVAVFGKLGLVDETLVVGKDGGIANIVVYVRTRDVDIHPDLVKQAKPIAVYDNKGGRFVPRILPFWLDKQKVAFTNSDPVAHNSNVQPLGDDGCNPLLAAMGGRFVHTFNRRQIIPVPVNCNLHPWMKGYVLPRDNPYAAVTDKEGKFTLKNVPAGTELEFQVWQEKAGYVAREDWPRGRFTMTLEAGKNDLGKIKLDPKLFDK